MPRSCADSAAITAAPSPALPSPGLPHMKTRSSAVAGTRGGGGGGGGGPGGGEPAELGNSESSRPSESRVPSGEATYQRRNTARRWARKRPGSHPPGAGVSVGNPIRGCQQPEPQGLIPRDGGLGLIQPPSDDSDDRCGRFPRASAESRRTARDPGRECPGPARASPSRCARGGAARPGRVRQGRRRHGGAAMHRHSCHGVPTRV